jgi:DNA-binding SARP family transcriptional activator/tetratricopeptide (TPR) repeat protein
VSVAGATTPPTPPTVPPAVRLLGSIEVVGPNGPAQLIGARQRGLVGLLALNTGSVVAQSRLVDALWGEDPPRTAVRSLHSHVSRVRQALQTCGLGDVLLTREPGYLLAVPRDQVDVHLFEDAVRAGAVEHLRAGLGLWRGDALADGDPAGWAAAEVERLHEARLSAVEELWDAELAAGRHVAAVGELERELVGRPGRERLVGLLMLALYRCGRHADALDRYERLRSRLADELGVDPGPQLQRLHTAILRRDPGLDLPEPEPAPLVPLPQTRPVPATGRPAAVPAQLPPPVGHFAGRADELCELDSAATQGNADDARIVVVSGPAGVGKTAFAVQWAHQARARFPDGQLFVDLRGHDPDAALTPTEALTHALRALGVPAERVPADLTEQTVLYRSLIHDRRLLVVLDNGGTADHVLPLVPSTDSSLLVVTSRHQLTSLAVHHGVRAVQLDVFSPDEGRGLLCRVLGAERVERESAAASELVELCGRMPLALRIAAAKLAARPRQDLAELVDELTGGDRLGALSVDGDARSVRTVFASAYSALSEPAARLFRLLGLHPGVHFTSYLAAALTGLTYGRARRSVDELAAAHLVTEIASGRYRFHDLVRLFARECAEDEEDDEQRAAAVGRIIEWYLSVADAANRTLDPARDRVKPEFRHPPADPPFEPRHGAVLAFLDGEHDNLLPLVEYAARHGHDEVAWQLTYLLAGYFESRGHWADRVAVGRCGLGAARQRGDPVVEGLMLSGLGVSCIASRRYDEALTHLRQALEIMRATGDLRGEGHVHNNLAAAYAELRRFDEAVGSFGQALDVHTANGHRHGQTLTLNNLGYMYGQIDQPELSLRHLERGLDLAVRDTDPRLEAAILHSMGQTLRRAGDLSAALARFASALDLRRGIGDRRGEARTLTERGTTLLEVPDAAAALDDFGAALALCRGLADPHGEAVALANLGRAHLVAGELDAAGERLRQATAARVRVPDGYEEATLHRHLAELCERLGEVAQAARHRDLAVGLYRKVNALPEAAELTTAHSEQW